MQPNIKGVRPVSENIPEPPQGGTSQSNKTETDKTPKTSALRPQVTAKEINAAMLIVQRNLAKHLNEKGNGAFASPHEILGALTEEYHELIAAVQKGILLEDVANELIDLTAGGLFGIACICADKVQW